MKRLKVFLLVLIIFIVIFTCDNVYSYSKDMNFSNGTNSITNSRINEIRNTPNTDISNRTGKVYYVSNNGSDTNDGLSPDKAWKTLSKINTSFTNGSIKNGDTILLNRGDIFRGYISIKAYDILIGSYGDEKKNKPAIYGSTHNGVTEGSWVKVKTNIWKYKLDNNENVFANDVGSIWFFCNSGNNNCSKSLEKLDKKFEYGQKIINESDYDETNMDEKISDVLHNDLEFYHSGHPYSGHADGKTLYVYSAQNPGIRFDDIEFSLGYNTINVGTYTNAKIDNLIIKYAGNHGVGASTIANLSVTNSEIGFIGGSVQSLNFRNTGSYVRFGNGIEVYGSVNDSKGYETTTGFVIDNNYVYQIYDAGITFQYTATNTGTIIKKVKFDNNVIEYCNYGIEYWNNTESTDQTDLANTYMVDVEYKDNIIRRSAIGVNQTRGDKTNGALIKTWNQTTETYNKVIEGGRFEITGNILDSSNNSIIDIGAGLKQSLPNLHDNLIFDDYNANFGYWKVTTDNTSRVLYKFIPKVLNKLLPNNEYYFYNTPVDNNYSDSGKTGSVDWNFNSDTHTLTISGSGAMKDYSLDDMPPWKKYDTYIDKIIIGENITHLGKYAFYELGYVEYIEINAKSLDDLSKESTNVGNNFTFYKTGKNYFGATLVFGSEVTRIPSMLLWPSSGNSSTPLITNVIFNGNKITSIGTYGLAGLDALSIVLPEGIQTLPGLSLGYSTTLRIIILPESVVTLSGWTFAGDTSLEKVVFGSNVKTLGQSTFRNCYYLKDIILPSRNLVYNVDFSNITDDRELLLNELRIPNMYIYGYQEEEKLVNDYNTFINDKYPEASDVLVYKNMDSLKVNINIDDELIVLSNNEFNFGDNIEFSITNNSGKTLDDIKAYYYFKDKNGNDIIFEELEITMNNGIYLINNVRNDIMIVTEKHVEEKQDDNNINNISNNQNITNPQTGVFDYSYLLPLFIISLLIIILSKNKFSYFKN